jgi:hypothetical protein
MGMGQAAQPGDSAVGISARFLGELDNLWSLLRVYGTEHPAFRRSAEAAAAAAPRPLRISLSPKGFTVDKTTLGDPILLAFSKRLRSLGLVGLSVEPGLTAAQVTSLILALDDCDRARASGTAVCDKITAVTDRRVTGIPLRLASLRLVEGTAEDDVAEDGQAGVWREMFAAAWHPSGGDGAGIDPKELAESFELALRAVGSPAQWEAMVAAWGQQLAAMEASTAAAPPPPPAQAGTGDPSAPAGSPAPSPRVSLADLPPAPLPGMNGGGRNRSLDSVAAFLGALSPTLSRRLLAETISGPSAPQNIILALAERLPKGIVLGALASVDRSNGQPSTAALALLRKMASNVPGAGGSAGAPAPRTTSELAEIAASLERLLGSDQEEAFVPDSYLAQRQDLSGRALSPGGGRLVAPYPTDRETSRHAAGLAFQILTTPDSSTANIESALTFARNRMGEWIRAGEFALAAEALSVALALSGHWDKTVAKPAAELAAHAVQVEDLLEGARRSERPAAVAGIAELLRRIEGTALARALSSLKPAGAAGPSPGTGPAGGGPGSAGGYDVVLEAMRRVLPRLSEDAAKGLCKTFKDTTPPPALLSVLSSLRSGDAIKAVTALLPHAASATRIPVVHVIFRQDFRWPLPLTESLLKDDEPELRRLAVMKVVSDTDLATAARFLQASSRAEPFEADVALGLAELLRHHRHHADVRAAWRQWLWCKRRWSALLFSPTFSTRRRAA